MSRNTKIFVKEKLYKNHEINQLSIQLLNRIKSFFQQEPSKIRIIQNK